MRPSRHILALCLVIFAVGNGCLSKSVVTQPEMTVNVVDDNGKALGTARVHYYRWSNPHHRLDGEADQATDPGGQATFKKTETTERVFPLCMHGVPEHHISVCVKNEGHRTVVFELDSPAEGALLTVPLHAGETAECDFEALRFPSGNKRWDIGRARNVSDAFELVLAGPAPGETLSVTEAKKQQGDSPITVGGYVSHVYTCPPCPPPDQCKPCDADHIVISEQNKKVENYDIAGDLVVNAKKAKAFELGTRVVLVVKPIERADKPKNRRVELVRVVSQ